MWKKTQAGSSKKRGSSKCDCECYSKPKLKGGLWLGLRGRGAARIKVNKIIKCRMQVARALKSERVADSAGKFVMSVVVLKLICESYLRSLRVFELIDSAGGRGDKIPKLRVVRIIDKGN